MATDRRDRVRAARIPRVSVVMAVYNGERYLREAIESVLRQSYTGFELLVIDDGSTDGTREILRSFDDRRIELRENPANIGLAASLNVGLRQARAPLVARLDADDVADPEWLRHMVSLMETRRDVALAATWFVETDPAGRVLEYGRPPSDTTMLRWRLLFHCPIVHSGVFLRRSLLSEIGEYDESLSYGEDYELWCRIAAVHDVTTCERDLVRIRLSDESVTGRTGRVHMPGSRRVSVEQMRRVAASGRQDPSWIDETFRAAAFALLWRPAQATGDESVIATVRGLFRLHDAFCRTNRLRRAEALAHRHTIRERLVRNLMGLAGERLRARDVAGLAEMVSGVALSYGASRRIPAAAVEEEAA